MSLVKRDIIDTTIDNCIIKEGLVGKIPLTSQLQEKRQTHKHDWQNGYTVTHNGKPYIKCGRDDCPVLKSANSNHIFNPTKPKKKNWTISGRYT